LVVLAVLVEAVVALVLADSALAATVFFIFSTRMEQL
jgi:hypothetical protein